MPMLITDRLQKGLEKVSSIFWVMLDFIPASNRKATSYKRHSHPNQRKLNADDVLQNL